MDFMNKAIRQINEELHIQPHVARRAVKIALRTITSQLLTGKIVQIRRFGSFQLTACKERTGRNPRTNEPVAVPATTRIRFRPSPVLTDWVRAQLKARKES